MSYHLEILTEGVLTKDIKLFADYLYQEDDSICLSRKRDKLYTISKEDLS